MNNPLFDFDQLNQRITRVETHYESLNNSLHSGFSEIKHIIQSNQSQTRSEIDSLLHRIDNKTKPQTGYILQIIGIAITIAVIAGRITASRIQGIEESSQQRHKHIVEAVERESERFYQHLSDGHADLRNRPLDQAQDARLKALERAVFND